MNDYSTLASRIRTSLLDVEKAVNRSLELSKKARTTSDDDYWDGVALNLHGFYTGVEHILEDIARTLENSLPSGSGWHADLLTQMSGAIEGVRPAVISRETRNRLDEFRGLRHVVRNVYVVGDWKSHQQLRSLPSQTDRINIRADDEGRLRRCRRDFNRCPETRFLQETDFGAVERKPR